MTIGKKILELRVQNGLTQKQLADMCGFSQSALNLWENGKRQPKINQVQKIASTLKVSINDLLESNLDDSPIYHVYKKNNDLNSDLFLDYKTHALTQGISWEPIDIKMIKIFKTLNEAGQAKAIERVEELTEIPRYTKKEKQPSPVPDSLPEGISTS